MSAAARAGRVDVVALHARTESRLFPRSIPRTRKTKLKTRSVFVINILIIVFINIIITITIIIRVLPRVPLSPAPCCAFARKRYRAVAMAPK